MLYDPRMMQQMGQMGLGMMGPQQGNPFANQAASARPKQWWEQPIPGSVPQMGGQDSQSANQPNRPPSLLDMLLSGSRMMPKAQSGQGGGTASSRLGFNPTGAPEALAMVSPWSWMGNMGLPGGAGWSGGTPG